MIERDYAYDEATGRNIGFVTEDQQDRLKASRIFVCGVGGMGGSAVQSLARAGVGHLALADIDRFEMSNLNRQVFASLKTMGVDKADAAAQACRLINPTMDLDVFGGEWTASVEAIIEQSDVVINGTDDLSASLLIYRTARKLRRPVVDAYASPLPSVFVTRPGASMPEERLGYPTIGTASNALDDTMRRKAFIREAEYVLLHSSSRHHIDLDLAGKVASGERPRMSFAPMVITTGNLMAYEAIGLVLGTRTATDENGWFFNPYKAKVEHPRNTVLAAMLRPFVRRQLARMTGA